MKKILWKIWWRRRGNVRHRKDLFPCICGVIIRRSSFIVGIFYLPPSIRGFLSLFEISLIRPLIRWDIGLGTHLLVKGTSTRRQRSDLFSLPSQADICY